MSSNTVVYVSPIAAPNPPLASDEANRIVVTMPTTNPTGPVSGFVKDYSFVLYGGSLNNNDQVAKDWKSAQTAAYTQANIKFDINQGYNIDGYVLEAKVTLIKETAVTNDYVSLCIQQGIAPGVNCSHLQATANTQAWSAAAMSHNTAKNSSPQYIPVEGVTPMPMTGFAVYDCTN
jgi:hypothetical protein